MTRIRLALVCFIVLLSPAVFAQWTGINQASCTQSTVSSSCSNYAHTHGHTAWRLVPISTSACAPPNGDGKRYWCEVWAPAGSSPCTSPQVWNQASGACVNPTCPSGTTWSAEQNQCMPDAPQCPSGSTWNGETCACPAGSKMGLKTGPEGGLVESCIEETPPPQECPEGSTQVGSITREDGTTQPICDNQHQCPPGYNPGLVNNEPVCSPDTSNPQCPNGGFYGTFMNTTGCFNPEPNVDNPDYPPNTNPDSPSYPGPDPENPTYPNDPSWPSANNPNYTGGSSSSSSGGGTFDDSRIVGQLTNLNSKASQTNSKLDTANETLSGIKDLLDAPEATAAGGEFNFGVSQSAREAAEAQYGAVINQIKSEASSMLSVSIGSTSGGLTDEVVETKWGQVTFGWGRWSGQLSLIGYVVLAMACVVAAYIILGD